MSHAGGRLGLKLLASRSQTLFLSFLFSCWTLALSCLIVLFSPNSEHHAVPIGAASQELTAPSLEEIELDLKQGRFRPALEKAQKLASLRPKNALAFTYLGMASLHLNLAEQALQAFERSALLDPKDARPLLNLALLHATRNDFDKAIENYQKALALEPDNRTALFNYGKLLIKRDRFAEAVEALKRSTKVDPEDKEARITLVEALLASGRRSKARDEAGILVSSSRVPPELLTSLAAILIRGQDLKLASTALNKALSMSPNLVTAHLEMSRLYAASSQSEKAIRSASRAVEISPNLLAAHLALAEAYIGAKKHREALDSLTKVEAQFSKSAALQYTSGIAQMGVNRFQPAIAAFEKAVQLDPSDDQAHFLLGTVCYATGDMDKAESAYTAAIRCNNRKPIYFAYLARVYDRKGAGFEEAARQATQQALALDPTEPECNQRLAKWAIARDDLAGAKTILEKVAREHPDFIPARVMMAQVYRRLGLRQQAEEQQRIIRDLEAKAQQQLHESSPSGHEAKPIRH